MAKAKVSFQKCVWLYLTGSLLGVLLEGIFCAVIHGHWETHVVSLSAPLCIIYGFGTVACYIGYVLMQEKPKWFQFLIYSAAGCLIELSCGLLLEHCLSMKAWDYSEQFLNIHGHVSLQMTLVWGAAGIAFSYMMPWIDRHMDALKSPAGSVICIILSILLALDLTMTAVVITRWSQRHFGAEPNNVISRYIDTKFDDDYMKDRFCEWHFIS